MYADVIGISSLSCADFSESAAQDEAAIYLWLCGLADRFCIFAGFVSFRFYSRNSFISVDFLAS